MTPYLYLFSYFILHNVSYYMKYYSVTIYFF